MYIDTYDSIKKLRIELEYITNKYIGYEAKEQISRIASLSKSYPHSIRLIKEAIIGQPQTFDFTCHQYTFGLVKSDPAHGLIKSKPIRRVINSYNDIFPKEKDVAWLVENYLTEINRAEALNGDFVIYFSEKYPAHSGLYVAGKINSKWGTCHLWEHGIREVPLSYGDKAKFFRKIPMDFCIDLFDNYAKSKIDKLKF